MSIKKKLLVFMTMVMVATGVLGVTSTILPRNVITAFATEDDAPTEFNSAADAIATYGASHGLGTFLRTTSSGQYTNSAQGPDGTMYYYRSDDEDAIKTKANAVAKKQADKSSSKAANEQKAKEGVAEIESYDKDLKGFEIAADTNTALGLMSGFMGVLSTLLGLVVVAVSLGMTVFSAFDLCYIAFPVFRNKCEDAKTNGGMLASNKKSANGEAKLRFVSDDAQYAVVAADTVQSGKNPFVIYFSKRLLSYLVLAILIFILLTGRVTVFTNIAVKLVSGLLNIIAGF